MHAVAVRVTLNDSEQAEAFLREQIVPQVAQAPGLVNAYWTRSADGGNGSSMIVFESEEAAKAMAERISGEGGPPAEAATIESVEVREVVASA
jgi:hypothetical protein